MRSIPALLGQELLSLAGVVPPAGGAVLVVGKGLQIDFPADVLVVRRAWGEGVGELKHFDRVVLLAGNNCPNGPEAIRQAVALVRPDGLLVLVAARPWFWGVRGTVWWRGAPRRAWLACLKAQNWVVADEATIGFPHPIWRRIFPKAGAVWVALAQKRVGGLRVVSEGFNPLSAVLKKPVPGACSQELLQGP